MKQKVMKACLGILWAMFTLTTFLLQSCDNGKEVTPAQGSGGSPLIRSFLLVSRKSVRLMVLQVRRFLFMEKTSAMTRL